MQFAQISVISGLLLAGVAGAALAADTTMTAKPAHADEVWLQDADVAGNAEVAAAQLALTRAQRADVKAFAQKMLDEHGATNRAVADLATRLGVALPAEKPKDHGLDDVKPEKFDAAYLQAQVKDHEKAQKLFEDGAKSKNTEIRALAEKTLPAIRAHLAEAKRLASMQG